MLRNLKSYDRKKTFRKSASEETSEYIGFLSKGHWVIILLVHNIQFIDNKFSIFFSI